MKRATTFLSLLALIGRFVGAIFRKKQNANTCQDVAVMIWYNGISMCTGGNKFRKKWTKNRSTFLLGNCKDSVTYQYGMKILW